ncbi:MAG: MerR family transcriptional regulator [Aliishimia sp.]
MSKSADAFRTISEVADWLGVQPHVLRFWESKFTHVKPVKRAGGRRYYRPADMQLLGGIRKLLHDDGLTIKGAQKVLREEGMAYVANLSQPLDAIDAENLALQEPPAEVQQPDAPMAETPMDASAPVEHPAELEAELSPTIDEALAAQNAESPTETTEQVAMFDEVSAPLSVVPKDDPLAEDVQLVEDIDEDDNVERPSFTASQPTSSPVEMVEENIAPPLPLEPEAPVEPEQPVEEAPMALDVEPESEVASLPSFLHSAPEPAPEPEVTEELEAEPDAEVVSAAPEPEAAFEPEAVPESEPTAEAVNPVEPAEQIATSPEDIPEAESLQDTPQDASQASLEVEDASLPSFLHSAPSEPAEMAAEGTEQNEADAVFDIEAAPDAPEIDAPAQAEEQKSLVVDAPDPVEADLSAAPSALSAAIRVRSLTPSQRTAVTPLVARLAAHRDQLAAGGAQSGWL